MNIIDIIAKKRDGKELSRKEIEYFIERIYRRKNPVIIKQQH